ncbi:hypothetical protein QZH46_22775 [Pseudomonas corrugata]
MNVIVQGWTVFKAFIALAYCTFACAGSMSTVMPIKVALADQSATSTFFVERRSGYTFALLFAWKSDYPGIKQQRDLWQGGYQRKGISLPIHLRILKDGQVFPMRPSPPQALMLAKRLNERAAAISRCQDDQKLRVGTGTLHRRNKHGCVSRRL